MAEKEGVYAPEPFEALDIALPEDLRTQTHQETHKLLITIWLESFVSCPSEEFKKAFIETFSIYGAQEFSKIQKLDGDYIHGKLAEAVLEFRTEKPEEYEKLRSNNSQSYIVFNGVSINFHQYLESVKPENTQNITISENEFGTEVENILGVGIHGREDVNNVEILKKLDLMIATSNKDFTVGNAEELLKDAFTLAFEREMNGVMREQTNYMRQNHDIWQEAFSERLTEISDSDLQSMLLFLPFVESNLNPRAKSDAGAIGLWQITLATAQRNSGGFDIVEKDLYDPLVSTKLAAKYLNKVILELKHDFPDADEEKIVMMALREYNGAWSRKLKPEYRKDFFKTVRDVYSQIDIITAVFEDTRLSDDEKIDEMMQYVVSIENTYFDGHGLTEYVEKEGYNKTSELLYSWSQNYLKKIVLQQLMYPYQVIGAYRAYQNIQNTL